MNDDVQRELQSIKGMVLAWKQSYLDDAPPPGEGDYLVEDFQEEIQMHVYPYTRRLLECNYLSEAEVSEFLEFCHNQVLELQTLLQTGTSGVPKAGD